MTGGEKSMDTQDFRIEFYNEAPLLEELELELAAEADSRLRQLKEIKEECKGWFNYGLK